MNTFRLLPAMSILAAALAAGCTDHASPSTSTTTARVPAGGRLGTLPGATPSAPAITSIVPPFGSPRMTVTVRGTGFGEGSTVFFGAVPAEVVSITAEAIVVHPAAQTTGATGNVAVTVASGSEVSNAVSFRLAARGDIVAVNTHPAAGFADLATLDDGSTLATDPSDDRIYRIGADGWVEVAAEWTGFAPRRIATASGKAPLIATASGIAAFDEASAAPSILLAPAGSPLVSAVWNADAVYALAADGRIDRLLGGDRATIANVSAACPSPIDLAPSAGDLFVISATRICRVDLVTNTVSSVGLTGTVAPMELRSVDATKGGLVVAGLFWNYGEAVATVAPNGALAIVAGLPMSAFGAVQTNDAWRVALDGASIVDVSPDAFRLKATPVTQIIDQRELGNRRFVTGGYGSQGFAFVAEIDAAGRTRIAANGKTPDAWIGLTIDGSTFVAASLFDSKIIRADATGATVLVRRDQPISGLARLADGSYLVSGYSSDIARYDAAGVLLDPAFIRGAGVATGLQIVDGQVYIAASDALFTCGVDGGEAQTLAYRGTASGMNGVALSDEGGMFVSDGNSSGAIFERNVAGELSPLAVGTFVVGVSASVDGSLLVADAYDLPYQVVP